jgi:hypothetical protein
MWGSTRVIRSPMPPDVDGVGGGGPWFPNPSPPTQLIINLLKLGHQFSDNFHLINIQLNGPINFSQSLMICTALQKFLDLT